jgi:hypothetical protein
MARVGNSVLSAVAYAPHHFKMVVAGSPHLLLNLGGTSILQMVFYMERDDAR